MSHTSNLFALCIFNLVNTLFYCFFLQLTISLMVNDRSLPAIRNELVKKGIPQVKATYSLYFDGEMIGSIIY